MKLLILTEIWKKNLLNTINIYGFKLSFGGYEAYICKTQLKNFLIKNNCTINNFDEIEYNGFYKVGIVKNYDHKNQVTIKRKKRCRQKQ